MQNIKIGLVASSVPVAVKSRVPLRFPSWNTQTIAPNVADRLSRLRITALMGITTDPNCRNSTAKVTRAMIAAASGGLAKRADRSEKRRGGKEGVSTVRYRGSAGT